jgi:phytoene dehydrogenase-like protein
MDRPDVIVIGAGHNGLVAATTMARAGKSVLVLERAAEVGGICARREFQKGFFAPGLLTDTTTFRADLAEKLELASHGLKWREGSAPIFSAGEILGANEEGDSVVLHADPMAAQAELAQLSEHDAAAYVEWRKFLATIESFITRILDNPPPRLAPSSPSDFMALGKSGYALRKLGRDKMIEVMRVMPMCAADWLREYFDSELLCSTLAIPAVINTYTGPWAAGSAAHLILRESVSKNEIAGGAPALIEALAGAAKAAGADIMTSSAVERIVLENGAVRAVQLASGDEIETASVVASCDPKQTMLQLVGPRYLDGRTSHDLGNFRARGTTAILHLAVEGSVEVTARAGEPIERLRLGSSTLDDIERAFDAIKYGKRSERPLLDVRIPTIEQPDLAPDGAHVVTALVSCAPYDLEPGWGPAQKEALIADCVRLLNKHIPGLRERLVGGELLSPPDLEELYALPKGHLHHGEHALDQLLFLRPTQHLSRYATSVDGLFLGGSGSHPGGGITGIPGRLAAQTALAAR